MSHESTEDLLTRDARSVLRPWSDTPVAIVEAKDCFVTDHNGKQYLDFTSGYFVNNAGHCHPKIVEAARDQLGRVMQVSGKQTTPPLIELAERLVSLTPSSLTKGFFTTGGSEATENALKIVRQHTEKPDVAGLDNAYHGLTVGALELCANDNYRKTAGMPIGKHTYRLPMAYCYRCEYADCCKTQCLDDVGSRLDERPQTSAIVAEAIQAVGGIAPPKQWWERLDEIRRSRGILLILDEIQTGLGRTGKMFAAEHYGLEPDILTGGKGLSGGVGSVGVVMVSSALADGFIAGTTPTSAGNAVSAAAGVALIDTLVAEGLVDNCAQMGAHFTEGGCRLDDPWIGDVRFHGLLGGIELVRDRETKEPLPKPQMIQIRDQLFAAGMLLTISGPLSNVLRLQPPLTITRELIDSFLRELKSALNAVRNG